MGTKQIHCQDQFEDAIKIESIDGIMEAWDDGYSTSYHLPVLRAIVKGLRAKKIGEIGFGRSSVILSRTAKEIGATYTICDRYDYRKYLPGENYLLGDADKFYKTQKGLDFLFLDYMSSRKVSLEQCYKGMKKAIKIMKTNGIIAIHDVIQSKYNAKEALKMIQKKQNVDVITLPYCWGLGLIRVRKSKHGKIVVKDVKREN